MNTNGLPAAIRILVVEDSPDDYALLQHCLQQAPFRFESHRVEDGPQMATALADATWDLVISDHNLPRFGSRAALSQLRLAHPETPFIIVSGMIGEDAAVEAMHAGADDYVMKSNMRRLLPAIERSLHVAVERRAKRDAQEAERLALEELRESRRQLSELAAHIESSKEAERAELAREIHDEMGGLLTGLKADSAWLAKHASDRPSVQEKIRDMESLLDEVVQVSRRIARSLRPAILDQGLNAALEWQAREFEKHAGIPCQFQTNRDDLSLGVGQATGVFRVFQEALTNVARHANAKHVEVQVFANEELVTLEVRDDGVGVSPPDLGKPDSFGIRGMKERVDRLGGWLDVNGAPGQGTTIMLSIPRTEPDGKPDS